MHPKYDSARSFDLGPHFRYMLHCVKSHRKNNIHSLGKVILLRFSSLKFGGSISFKVIETWHIMNLNAKFVIISSINLGNSTGIELPWLLKAHFWSHWRLCYSS